MARWVSLVLAVCLICTGCAAPNTAPVVSGFRCQADITYGGASYAGVLDRTDPATATLTLHEPVAMSGLVMQWDGQAVHVQYMGMNMTVDEAELPVGAVIRVLCDTLDACAQGNVTSATVEGESACGPYTLCMDASSGLPLELRLPLLDLTVTFSAWELPEN